MPQKSSIAVSSMKFGKDLSKFYDSLRLFTYNEQFDTIYNEKIREAKMKLLEKPLEEYNISNHWKKSCNTSKEINKEAQCGVTMHSVQ